MASEAKQKAIATAVAKWGELLPHMAKDSIMLFFDGVVAEKAKKGVSITGFAEGASPKGYPATLVSFSDGKTFYAYGHQFYAVKV